jgi:hypothetical protein
MSILISKSASSSFLIGVEGLGKFQGVEKTNQTKEE